MNSADHMSKRLPPYYRDSRVVENLNTIEGNELDQMHTAILDLREQLFIDTATWGLAIWERICGVTTDLDKPYSQRRSVIKSKLRGIGTVTVSLIKSVAEAYVNGSVEVIEQPSDYTIVIQYVSTLGVPDNIQDIQNALREIIPAHLLIEYQYTYLTVVQLQAMTINELQITKLNKFAPVKEVLN